MLTLQGGLCLQLRKRIAELRSVVDAASSAPDLPRDRSGNLVNAHPVGMHRRDWNIARDALKPVSQAPFYLVKAFEGYESAVKIAAVLEPGPELSLRMAEHFRGVAKDTFEVLVKMLGKRVETLPPSEVVKYLDDCDRDPARYLAAAQSALGVAPGTVERVLITDSEDDE